MAEFLVPLGTWESENASLSSIDEALRELRAKARASARVSVVNLVVVVHDYDGANRALEVLAEMGARHPARTILFVIEPGASQGEPHVRVKATLLGSYLDGHPVSCDVVEMNVCGPAADHLDSLADPLTLVDVPLAVWYFETEPVQSDSLLKVADAVIVDTKELGAAFALAEVAEIIKTHPVIDLSWVRLRPWRELLANLFEGEVLRPYVDCVTSIEVYGKSAPRRLLSGWLSAQLGIGTNSMLLEDAQHAGVRIKAEHDGSIGEFSVLRDEDERIVVATVTIDDEVFYTERVALRDRPIASSLTYALMHLTRSPLFERAITSGLSLESVS